MKIVLKNGNEVAKLNRQIKKIEALFGEIFNQLFTVYDNVLDREIAERLEISVSRLERTWDRHLASMKAVRTKNVLLANQGDNHKR